MSPLLQRRRCALGGTVSNVVATGIGQAAIGLTLVVLANRISLTEFGAFVTLYAIAVGLAILLDFGSNQRMTRDVAVDPACESFARWLGRRTLLQAPIAAIFTVLATLYFADRLGALTAFLLSSQTILIGVSEGLVAIVRGAVNPALAAWFIALGNLVVFGTAILATPALLPQVAAAGFVASWILTSLAASAAILLFVPRSVPVKAPRNPWHGSGGFGLAQASWALQILYVPVIGLALGPAAGGLVGAVARWLQPVVLLPTAYAAQVFPSLSAAHSWSEAERRMWQFPRVVFLAAALAGTVFVLAPTVVELLLGPEYRQAAGILRWYAIAALPVIVAIPIATLIQARRGETYVAKVALVSVSLSLLALGPLAHLWGPVAAPIVLGLSAVGQLTAMVFRLRLARRAG